MKTILLTNDDGFGASGLLALRDALSDIARIVIVAPSVEKSATSHSLTITKPLRLIAVDDDYFKLDDGSPADCVYIALETLFKEGFIPDLIISGINIGSNMGEDITYSGTVGAAMEGVLHDIPSIAISQVYPARNNSQRQKSDFTLAKKAIRKIVQKILNDKFPLNQRELLNINIPPSDEFKGYKITHVGCRSYGGNIATNHDPRGNEYHWIGVPNLNWRNRHKDDKNSDFQAIEDGYISITPIHLDMTSYDQIKRLEDWIK